MGHTSTIHDLLASYRCGSQSPEQVFGRAVSAARAAHKGDGNNEWIYVVSDEQVSKQLEKLSTLSESLPLYGVPFAVKDNIDVGDIPTTAGCPEFAYTPKDSAICVQRLCEAGALFVGKTNLDQFATGLVGTRSPFGAVPCSFDSDRISGGSSSGSAAVVSRGVVHFSLGTDTAGSGRVPAAFNGIVGLKPSVGKISTHGIVPACASLDCVSVFSLTPSDAARILAVLESPSPLGRSTDIRFAYPPLGAASFPTSLHVGVPMQLVDCMDQDFRSEFRNICEQLRTNPDIAIVPVDFTPLHTVADLLYGGPWLAERYLTMADILRKTPKAVNPVVRTIVSRGEDILAQDAFRGFHKLAALRQETEAIWNDIHVLLVPSTPHHPTMREIEQDPLGKNNELGSYTNFVNLLGWCALATPCSILSNKLPFGVTWISRAGNDTALLRFACNIQPGGDVTPGAPDSGITVSEEARVMPEKDMTPISERVMKLAVVGAHLKGMPLHHELIACRAKLERATRTSKRYRLYALAGTKPAKPGLVRTGDDGHGIEIEVYDIPISEMGSFLSGVPHPLGLGSVETENGDWVTGFICEGIALDTAIDVSEFGGWRAYLTELKGN